MALAEIWITYNVVHLWNLNPHHFLRTKISTVYLYKKVHVSFSRGAAKYTGVTHNPIFRI